MGFLVGSMHTRGQRGSMGKTEDKAKSSRKWPTPPTLLCPFSTLLLNKYFKNSFKGQQIKRLSLTAISLASSIYNIELKSIREKQSQKDSAFLLVWKHGNRQHRPWRCPSLGVLSPEKLSNTRVLHCRYRVCEHSHPYLHRLCSDHSKVMEDFVVQKRKNRGVERRCKQKLPISV